MIRLKGIVEEDFANYKKSAMFLIFPFCTFKCEACPKVHCQNHSVMNEPDLFISAADLYEKYINNPITKAIVCGGLEPFDTPESLMELVRYMRIEKENNDDIVIFTGYTEKELEGIDTLEELKQYKNIIIKFGRFIPDNEKHFDEVLGIYLISDNQYAKEMYNGN